MMSLLLGKQAGDGGESPVLIGLVKFRGGDSLLVQGALKPLKLSFVAYGQSDVRRMVVMRTSFLVSIL